MNAAELLTLRASSPLRRPSWRWDLARFLTERPTAQRMFTVDAAVGEAQTVQRAFAQNPSEADMALALGVLADGADAFQFWSGGQAVAPQGADAPRDPTDHLGPFSPAAIGRAQLEALILADKSAAAIAKVTGLSAAAVGYYERWYFDIRDRLKNAGWIAVNVIGPLLSPSPYVTLPNLIRAYGFYTGSSRIVRTVVGGFDKLASRKAASDPHRFFNADAAAAGSLKAALAVRMMSITDSRAYGRIIELHNETMTVEAKNVGTLGSGSEEKYRDATQALFGRLSRGHREVPDEGQTFELNPATRFIPTSA